MTRFSPATPLGFLELFLRVRIDRARESDSRGASVVEWVVIAAIVVAIALAIGLVLREALETKADEIGNQISESGGGV